MAFKDPAAITEAGTATGIKKAKLPYDKQLVAGFLAGAYIAFAGILAITVSAGLDPAVWGTLPSFFTGVVFVLGLVLVIVGGAELLTGNMALVPLAAYRGKVKLPKVFANLGFVAIGNLLGSLFVAYFVGVKSGVLTAELPLERLEKIAVAKGVDETNGEIFLRALGCNWLVCLAVWMAIAAEDIAGKIAAIFFPIMAFVAMGFDHVVANMFFLPAAIFADLDITWANALNNWLWAFLGNLVAAAVFVAGFYWYLYGRGEKSPDPGDTERGQKAAAGDGNGAGAADGQAAGSRALAGR